MNKSKASILIAFLALSVFVMGCFVTLEKSYISGSGGHISGLSWGKSTT
jgi:hypothetical protein